MMAMPAKSWDVLGLDLSTARCFLAAQGQGPIHVEITRPPGKTIPPAGPLRVVRQRWTETGIELVVAGEMKSHD